MIATVLTLAVAFGVSPYATIAMLGALQRIGWLLPLPLVPAANPWVLTLAVILTFVEFVATLVPGVASAWEAVHAIVRPPAAIAMSLLLMWGGDPALVLAVALLAGTIAFGTTLTKLGARLAIDTSPEPVSNAAANVGELTLIGLIAAFVWQHPVASLIVALVTVAALALIVRALWGMIWRTVTRTRRPGVGSIRS